MTAISRAENRRAEDSKPRLVRINDIALEVGGIEQTPAFDGRIFDLTLRATRPGNAFIELGDQFNAAKIEKAQRERADQGMAP
ncbi:MAG TPA: hypothetical protein VGM07_22275 [Stellaceae bacterium]|jgi:hypothetical protein